MKPNARQIVLIIRIQYGYGYAVTSFVISENHTRVKYSVLFSWVIVNAAFINLLSQFDNSDKI